MTEFLSFMIYLFIFTFILSINKQMFAYFEGICDISIYFPPYSCQISIQIFDKLRIFTNWYSIKVKYRTVNHLAPGAYCKFRNLALGLYTSSAHSSRRGLFKKMYFAWWLIQNVLLFFMKRSFLNMQCARNDNE